MRAGVEQSKREGEVGSSTPLIVYGAGGLARETAWLVKRLEERGGTARFKGYIVSDLSTLGSTDSVDEVLGDESWLEENPNLLVAIGIGTPGPRREIGKKMLEKLGAEKMPALVDPSVVHDEENNTLEPGVVVTAGCILTTNVVVERFAFINLDCTVGHEAIIGEGAVLNPSVNVSGGVKMGKGVMVGTGAQILQYLTIGDGAMIGAGAVVTKDVAAGETVVGVPARPLKRKT